METTPARPLPLAYVSHRVAGRSRLRVPSRRGDRAYFETLERRLAQVEPVAEVYVNAVTGSVVIRHRGLPHAVLDEAREAGLFDVEAPDRGEPRLIDRFRSHVASVDTRLRDAAPSGVNLRVVTSALVIGLSITQLLRGQILGPVTTLSWFALNAMTRSARSQPQRAELQGPA